MDPIVKGELCYGCRHPINSFPWYWVIKSRCYTGVGLHNMCESCKCKAEMGRFGGTVLAAQCYRTKDGQPVT